MEVATEIPLAIGIPLAEIYYEWYEWSFYGIYGYGF
jgi:hypothetical protein